MAQVWAQAAAYYFGIQHIHTFSGGTQKTAFNISAVNALKKAGFKISRIKDGKNPKAVEAIEKNLDKLECTDSNDDNFYKRYIQGLWNIMR